MMDDRPPDRDDDGTALGDEAIDWLVRLRSGRATAADHAAFRAWRDHSPAHAAAARAAERLWREVGTTSAAERHRRAARTETRVSRRVVVAGGIAMSLAAAVAVANLWWPASSVVADHATRTGERREIRLPDGSRAVLDTATAVSVRYSAAERRVLLHTGEALFAVATEVERPFVVATAEGDVRALGTRFAVRREGARVRVVVTEGTVAMRADVNSTPVSLTAGQRASIGPDRQIVGPEPIDPASATAWTRGKLVFNRRPLAEVVAELERYRAGRILIMRSDLARLKVSGVFDLDNPGTLVDTLETTLPLRVVRLPFVTLLR